MIQNWRFITKFLFCQIPIITEHKTLRQKLIKFPYSFLSQSVINRTFAQDPSANSNTNLINQTTAFASLRQQNMQVLNNYYKTLFNEEYKGEDALTGFKIFRKYFIQNITSIKNTIKNSRNQQQITFNLKILFFLKDHSTKEQSLDWDFENIKQNGTLCQKAYLLHIYSQTPKFLQFLQKFTEQFKKASKQDKVEAALVIISVHQFYDKYPSNLYESCIEVLSTNVQNMDDWQLFKIISNVFMTNSTATKILADAIMRNMLKQITEDNVQAKIPLFHKLLKLRGKLKMNNSELQKYIKENPLRFNSLFLKKKINKQPFLEVAASKNAQRYLPEQIKIPFVDYIFKIFQTAIQKQECDQDEIIEAIKLTLKFYFNFNQPKVAALITMFETQLIPMFEDNRNITFWLITCLLRMDKTKLSKPNIQAVIKKIQDQYHEQYMKQTDFMQKHKCLQKIIQIYYHFTRANIQTDIGPLKKYDFKYVTTFQQVIYATYLLNKIQLSPEERFKHFARMVPRIIELHDQNKFKSIKNLFIIFTCIQKSTCPELEQSKLINHLLLRMQKAYMHLLGFQNQCPPSYSLIFVRKLYRDNKTQDQQIEDQNNSNKSPKFKFNRFVTFLNKCLQSPQKFRIHYSEYKTFSDSKPKYNPKKKY